jgi:predicted  nucleic acid-binding Zn-ribbon protein
LDPSLIEILANLQEIDRRNRERELELAELERQSSELQGTLELKRAQVAGTRAESGSANTRRRELEAQLQDAESRNKERRMRLGRIRNDKELIVAQREIEIAKEANSRLEEEILTLLEQTEAVDGGLREAESELGDLEGRVAKHEEHARARIEQLRAEIDGDRGERESIASRLSASIRKKYEQIFARRGGIAVVEVRRGICLGCNMHLPPQLYIEIQKGREVHLCPNCNRILFHRAEQANEASSTNG